MASPSSLGSALADPELQASITLTVVCATAATLIAALLGVPLGFLLARARFPGAGSCSDSWTCRS
jgi:ABC-type sulfate transport system permease component